MEFDSTYEDSDGPDPLIADNGDLYFCEYYNGNDEEQPSFLEAKTVYILMPKNIRISRSSRLQWFIDHLNTVIIIKDSQINYSSGELEVISAVPRENSLTKCNRYLITSRTEVMFLAHMYRFVFCLDMSPSQATVDIEKGEILFDEVLSCFKSCMEGLLKEFTIPGSSNVFQPCIYITVMVNTPFFISPAQQVLVKGIQISRSNLQEVIQFVQNQFYLIEGKIADVAAIAHDQIEFQNVVNEAMVSPDVNFVNMLRYSMLAVSLLPENSISHILVITDGVVAMPDSSIMESLLFQIRYDSVSVSFLKVGSIFHPHASAGYVSYSDLLSFLAQSTMGVCLENYQLQMSQNLSLLNTYHQLFFFWSFHYISSRTQDGIRNFGNFKTPVLLTKRQSEENISASIYLLLSRRMREGFIVDSITYFNGLLDIRLCLQWKPFIYIYYKISSPSIRNNVHFEVYISAPYEFLHDITCVMKKDQKSVFRQAVIDRFWLRLSHLSTMESSFLQHLSTFPSPSWFSLPECVRSRIPVFELTSSANLDSIKVALSSTDPVLQKFGSIWLPICQMETSNWRKWFHTHRISLILKHDQQLPKYLHSSNSSHRYQVVQCRQAATILHEMLANWSSCILVDNHTYLKLVQKEQTKPPSWFSLIRITSKLPCAVLNIGFFTSTPGYVRHEVCEELKSKLSSLTFKPASVDTKENFCCLLLQKPLEKVLIRYERIPTDFNTVVFPDGTQPPSSSSSVPAPVTNTLFTTLSRYLFHKRWIWSAMLPTNPKLTDTAISRILSTLTRMRLKEDFSFVHSSSGIVTMALELWMNTNASCVVQYVLFPPHRAWRTDGLSNCSEDESDPDNDYETELQMVTEVWIEPQYGKVIPKNLRTCYMDNKHYYEIADVISKIDRQCINSLLTVEHLSLMCQEKMYVDSHLFSRMNSLNSTGKCHSLIAPLDTVTEVTDAISSWYPINTQRIEHIPFNFHPIGILPLCHLTEMLFSMFLEGKQTSSSKNIDYIEKPNVLLLDNLQEHLSYLHDQELELTKEDSDNFVKHILSRHKNKQPAYCPIIQPPEKKPTTEQAEIFPRWRCFLKGISVTHIIMTFVPASLQDLKDLTNTNDESINVSTSNDDSSNENNLSSKESNCSDVPIYSSKSLSLPVYIFDCPLAAIVNAYISNLTQSTNFNNDVYEDHRFKYSDYIQEDSVRLKPADFSRRHTDEELENMEERNTAKCHCRALVISHLKCFTVSLFLALHHGLYIHSSDAQSVMDHCDESIVEIDITEYMKTVCGHLKNEQEQLVNICYLNQAIPCSELKSVHSLVKEKFFKIVNKSFSPVPTNTEFYFCHGDSYNRSKDRITDSDDEVSNVLSDFITSRLEKDLNIFSEGPHSLRMGSGISDMAVIDIYPLFLHFICTLRFNNVDVSNTSVRLLPTCLGELIRAMDTDMSFIDKSKLQVTLDIFCLTLPKSVQDIIMNYSCQGQRTTSFCSDGFPPSIGSTISQSTFNSEQNTELHHSEPYSNFPETQKRAIITLRDEIKWLLHDEIATALLDVEPVTANTLNFVTKHVVESNGRSSCLLEVIDLNFVFESPQSHDKFVQEFSDIRIPGYKLCKEDDMYYLIKDQEFYKKTEDSSFDSGRSENNAGTYAAGIVSNSHKPTDICSESVHCDWNEHSDAMISTENNSQVSDISSESVPDTDGGYDEDISDDDQDYDWLIHIDNKRQHLPNFWLIMKIQQEAVEIYFHCRFMDLPTAHVAAYLEVQRTTRDSVRAICKRVNQSLLLQSLYETRICNSLLEPEEISKDWGSESSSSVSQSTSYNGLKESIEDDNELMMYSASLSEASLSFKPGHFRCPVIWETHFILHPRLKAAPSKPGTSRGMVALKNVLDKFSVSNRNNMFVYQDKNSNVFYLRLHEKISTNTHMKIPSMRSNEYENLLIARSPSVTSLPLGHSKSVTKSEQSISSTMMMDIRPRVRSFGEKDSKEDPEEDTLILKVHGITEAGTDVQCELIQVLQNRLDDAVLECLSVMLARNSMCPLTPEDVHFIQKPFKPSEVLLKLSLHEAAIKRLESFNHYLRQNLMQFLNIPKYTDNRFHYHFKDYAETEQMVNRTASDDNIFIYNQSQNPASGNRGISCIAFTVIMNKDRSTCIDLNDCFKQSYQSKDYENLVKTDVIPNNADLPPVYLEFRLWNQGRVNVDTLTWKLKLATRQATWDIILEYCLLRGGLCESLDEEADFKMSPILLSDLDLDMSKEIQFHCNLVNNKSHVRPIVSTDDGRKIDTLLLPRKKNRRIIPLNAKTTRSITFEDSEKESSTKSQNVRSSIKITDCESGNEGVLSENYAKYLPEWLEFGSSISVPSVRRHQINLNTAHFTSVTIREMLNLIHDYPKAFRAVETNGLKTNSDEKFPSFPMPFLIQRCILISRNFEQWKVSTAFNGTLDFPDILNPQSLKHIQKFTPGIQNGVFIPRQKILWILVEDETIIIYTYNWTKESVEKLINSCTNLGLWLNVRSSFLSSVTAQKLGLFHNQAITRKAFISSNNPYATSVGSLDSISEFPREHNRRPSVTPGPNLVSTVEVFKDAFYHSKHTSCDPVVVFTIEMNELRVIEKKLREEMKKLHLLYQSRTSSTTVPNIQLLLQHSRIVHFCHTPLLFLSGWRLKSAATRDHSFYPDIVANVNDRTMSNEKESWHTDLCYSFFTEYRSYLQTLGFIPLQIDCQPRKPGLWSKDSSSYNSIFYIQKTILGGILLFTMEFIEPFFTTRLHAIECNRLQTIHSIASINRFTLGFLDECDKIKILIHLHSFTYDYHLRSICNYISDNGLSKLPTKYNVNYFLHDFIKYYTKAPNFARNLIYADIITVGDLLTEGRQLFEYLLSNVRLYKFRVLEMETVNSELEYALVQVSNTSQIFYKDAQDCQQTDDFDLSLIIYYLCTPYNLTDNTLHLKYYLILTPKHEIYPKSDMGSKIGKFRTVSSFTNTYFCDNSPNGSSDRGTEEQEQEEKQKEQLESQYLHETQRDKSEYPIEISPEHVNYLGYYSSHEEFMQQLILEKAKITKKSIEEMIVKAMVDCRTHLLWNLMVKGMSFDEFIELKGLSKLEHLCDIHQNLGFLANQPLTWYQGLAKLLIVKYADQYRLFTSLDGNIQHYVILHPRYFGAFMMLSLDVHTTRGDLYAVYRETPPPEDLELCLAYRKELLDDFVNCICFYLWSGMI